MLEQFSGSYTKALSYAFPDVPFEDSKFNVLPRISQLYPEQNINRLIDNYWMDKTNRLKFLVQYAQARGLNHLKAEDWYPVSRTDVASFKVRSKTLNGTH